jgi:LCP family protein required for cell wall assembly
MHYRSPMHYRDPQPRRRRPGRRLIPARRWPRRVLYAANVVVAVTLIGAGLAYGYVRYRLDSIHTLAVKNLTPDSRDTARGLPPENILLIGNQSRACLTTSAQIAQFGNPALLSGSLSDVIMVMHLDPKARTASVLSIPRDLFEPMPPGTPSGPYEKIDSALNDGANGPANLIDAIQGDLGIPINHFVEVDFCGFEQTVNALGGIKMDFPEPLYDLESQLNITQTGCQLINGATALALVRSRHLQYDPPTLHTSDHALWPYDPESDLARIVRDHEFLKVLITTAQSQGLYNPLKLNSFLSALTNQVTMDPGLRDQLISLAAAYRNVAATNLPETTLPVTTYSSYTYDGNFLGDVDFAVEPADDQVIQAWDPSAFPTPQNPSAVEVFNAVGAYQLATQTGTALTGVGQHVTTEANAPILGNPAETLVRYNPSQLPEALAVLDDFTGAVTMQPDATVPAGTVMVDVGTDESVVAPPATTGAAGPSPSTAGPAPSTTGAAPASAGSAPPSAATTPTTVPTIGGAAPSASNDNLTPYDPRPC